MTKFSLVLVIYDPRDSYARPGVLERILAQLAALRGNFELVVVNNNPLDAAPKLTAYLRQCHASSQPLDFRLLEPNENLGSARGFNYGFESTRKNSTWVVYVCPDADVVDPETLTKIARSVSLNERIGIAHPLSVYEDVRQFNVNKRYGIGTFRRAVRNRMPMDHLAMSEDEASALIRATAGRDTVTGKLPSMPLTFALLRRGMLEQIGLFEEKVKLVCGENDDLAYRALLAGYDIVSINSAFVGHRRLLFSHLNRSSETTSMVQLHPAGLKDHQSWWTEKWGRPYRELYIRWRYGAAVASSLRPLFLAHRYWRAIRTRAQVA